MDGGDIGELEYECFNAAAAKIIIHGVSVHTGYAKGKMINAARLAAEFNALIPTTDIPETTEGYEGFYHLPVHRAAIARTGKLSYIIRDHDRQKFEQRKKFLADCVAKMNEKYGEGVFEITPHRPVLQHEGEDRAQYARHRLRAQGHGGDGGEAERSSRSVAARTAPSSATAAFPAPTSSLAASTSTAPMSLSPSR